MFIIYRGSCCGFPEPSGFVEGGPTEPAPPCPGLDINETLVEHIPFGSIPFPFPAFWGKGEVPDGDSIN